MWKILQEFFLKNNASIGVSSEKLCPF